MRASYDANMTVTLHVALNTQLHLVMRHQKQECVYPILFSRSFALQRHNIHEQNYIGPLNCMMTIIEAIL